MTDDRKRGRGGAGGVVGGLVFGVALNFLLNPLVARTLGPSGRGQVALVGVYDDASTAVFVCGLPLAVGYFAKAQLARPGELLTAARSYGFAGLPFSLAAAVAVVAWPLSGLSQPAKILGFLLVALSPLANTLGMSCRQLLMNQGDLRALRALPVLTAGFRFVVCVAAALAGVLTVPVAIVALSFGNYVTNIYAWWRCRVRTERPAAPLRPLLRYGVRAMPASLSNLANSRLDQLLIAPFLGTRALGLYAIAVAFNIIPQQVGQGLGFARFSVMGRDEQGRRALAAALRTTWVVTGLAAVATGVLLVLAVPVLYGPRFAGSVVPGLVLLPGTVALAVNLVAQQGANALGRPEFSSYSQLAALVVTAVGLPIAIPAAGITGAAVVSSVAYAVRLAVGLLALRRVEVSGTAPRWDDLTGLARSVRSRSSALAAPRQDAATGQKDAVPAP